MKKYLINFGYDAVEDMFVAVCPEFFGFIAYYKNIEELKKGCLKLLKIYANDKEISPKSIEFAEQKELEMEL